jgi:hypothetical protein
MTMGENMIASAAIAIAWLAAAPALAQRGSADDDKPPFTWDVVHGSVAATVDGQRWIGTSDAAAGEYSQGRFRFPRAVAPDVEISVRARRMSNDASYPIEVWFAGGAFLVTSDGRYGFWGETDARWSGWHANGAITSAENLITVRQRGRRVEGYVNSVLVGAFDLELDPVPAAPSVFFKGAPGSHSRIEFWDFSIRDLSRTGRRRRDAAPVLRAPAPIELRPATPGRA